MIYFWLSIGFCFFMLVLKSNWASKSRELYPKLFLINSALKKNFDCFIGDKVSIARAVKILGKGIYIGKISKLGSVKAKIN